MAPVPAHMRMALPVFGGMTGLSKITWRSVTAHKSRMVRVTAIKLDGKLYREEIFADLAKRVEALKAKGITPGLATVLVGEDPASQNYVRMKHKDCEQLGIASIMKELPGDCTQEELDAVIEELNNDDAVTGYIVQLPLPKHLDENLSLIHI